MVPSNPRLRTCGASQASPRARVLHRTISDVNVECPFPGYLHLPSGPKVHLFPLSPDTIEHSRRAKQVELRTVYISHPTRPAAGDTESKAARPFDEPLGSINLVLPTRARDALRAQGYTVEFRHPEQGSGGADNPNTHRLTLSHNNHCITVEYQHSLQSDGRQFTIDAVVGVALSPLPTRPSMGVQEQETFISRAVSWSDPFPWWSQSMGHSVIFDRKGAHKLAVNLDLRLAGTDLFLLGVEIQ